ADASALRRQCRADDRSLQRHGRQSAVDCASLLTRRASQHEWNHSASSAMIRKYTGDKKSIEARSGDNGRTWSVKLFDAGRMTQYTGGALAGEDGRTAHAG